MNEDQAQLRLIPQIKYAKESVHVEKNLFFFSK